MDVLNRIMELLERNGRTQKELMDYLGIKKSAFTDWKAGKSRSYLKYASEIADYFGVTTDYLLRGETDIKEKPHADEIDMEPKEKLLLEKFRQLTPEMQEFVLSSVQAQSDKLKKERNQ